MKDVGMLLPCPLIPHPGSRIALHQDKQLELAHVVIYKYTTSTHIIYNKV